MQIKRPGSFYSGLIVFYFFAIGLIALDKLSILPSARTMQIFSGILLFTGLLLAMIGISRLIREKDEPGGIQMILGLGVLILGSIGFFSPESHISTQVGYDPFPAEMNMIVLFLLACSIALIGPSVSKLPRMATA